jgi:hypothetical protein
MNTATRKRPCGHPDCSVSTGIHDGLTFGCGELCENGFWQYPCDTCARAHEKRDGVPSGTYWPFPRPIWKRPVRWWLKFVYRHQLHYLVCSVTRSKRRRDESARRLNELFNKWGPTPVPGPRWLWWLYARWCWLVWFYLAWPVRKVRGW